MKRLSILIVGTFLVSCSSTYEETIIGVKNNFYTGNLVGAEQELQQILEEHKEGSSYHTCLMLEEAIVRIAAGNGAKAEANLRQVRDEFDRIEAEDAKAFFGEMSTYFTDDRSKSYGGEDYEKILIRVMLAFSNLLQGGEDVIAYANQVLEKQRQILDEEAPDRSGKKYKKDYKKVGIGAYIYGLVTEERDPTAGNEARISYNRVKEWEPQFTAINDDLERLEEGHYAEAGNGVLYVFAFAGKGPQKFEIVRDDVAVVSELAAQMIRFIPEVGKYYGPTIDLSPIRVPELQPDPTSLVGGVMVDVNGDVRGNTSILTDVTRTSLQYFSYTRDWVLTKAVVRRMVKKAIVTAAKGTGRMMVERNSKNSHRETSAILFELGGMLANTLWTAMERADTRMWSLLPDTIQVLRLELPAGDHEITLTPLLKRGGNGASRSVRATILAGHNTYVFGFIPSPGPGPALLTDRPVEARELTLR